MRKGYAVPLIWLALATSTAAQEVPPLEINQTCAVETGCFPGDDPGFPVTITQPGDYILTSWVSNSANDADTIFASTGTTVDTIDIAIDLGGFGIGEENDLDWCLLRGSRFSVRNGTLRAYYCGFRGDVVLVEDVSIYQIGNSGCGSGLAFGTTELPLLEMHRVYARSENTPISCSGEVLITDSSLDGYFLALSAGPGSRIARNTISYSPMGTGISCSDNCAVFDNDVYSYNQFGASVLVLGETSYYFSNEIEFCCPETRSTQEVVGGISLDPDQIGAPTPNAPLNTNADTDSGADIFPQIATDGVGHWVTVWQSNNDLGGSIGTDWDILLARSIDDGLTWSDPAALNKTAEDDSANDVEPVIIADAAGNWVAAWSSTEDLDSTVGGDRDILFSRSADAGTTWTNVGALNTNADTDSGSDERPFITTNGGIFLAAWQSNNGPAGPDYDIWVAQSFTGGASWAAPILLNSTGGGDSADDVHPVLATDSTGNWLAVWETNDAALGGDGDLLVARSTDDGTTWTAPIPLNQNAATDRGLDAWPTINTDGAGTWLVAWESSEDLGGTLGMERDLLFARSIDNGATWSNPQPLNGNAASDLGDDANPNLTVDNAGNWTVVWDSGEDLGRIADLDVDILIARSTDRGSTWSSPALLNTAAGSDLNGDYNPKIATNLTGDISIAVWHSDEDLGGTAGLDWDVLFSAVGCLSAGDFLRSTDQLAAFQDNHCEDWSSERFGAVNLESAVLTKSDLTDARFDEGSSLMNASLSGAILEYARLRSVNLTGATYDENTIFPTGNTYDTPPWGLDGGISPWNAGMIPVPEPAFGWMMVFGTGALACVTASGRRIRRACSRSG